MRDAAEESTTALVETTLKPFPGARAAAPDDDRTASGSRAATSTATLDDDDRGPLAAIVEAALTNGWSALPARYKLAGATSLAFVICNMVRWKGRGGE